MIVGVCGLWRQAQAKSLIPLVPVRHLTSSLFDYRPRFNIFLMFWKILLKKNMFQCFLECCFIFVKFTFTSYRFMLIMLNKYYIVFGKNCYIFPVTLPNVDRFSEFFQRSTY